jgi:hypothetical protein
VEKYVTWSDNTHCKIIIIDDMQVTAICIQAQNANIFVRFFMFETGVYHWKRKYIHRSCDVLQY